MFSNMMQAPCKGCEERQLHCHSECESYIKYSELNEIERAKADEERRLSNMLDSIAHKRYKSLANDKPAAIKHKGFKGGSRLQRGR